MLELIYGGSASGKSAYAEQALSGWQRGRKLYLATMQPWDAECQARIAAHRMRRADKGFETMECFGRLTGLAAGRDDGVLLECLSNALNNIFWDPALRGQDIASLLYADLKELEASAGKLIIVCNDIFSDCLPLDPETLAYRDCLAALSCRLAADADRVTRMIYGIPLVLKEFGERRVSWT